MAAANFALIGLKQVRKRIEAGHRGISLASAKALTFTAERAQRKTTKFIPVVFSQPTPFTRKSVRKTAARPNKLESNVFFKDISPTRRHYLEPQVAGGFRPQKAAEKRLGGYWVPGKDARLNKYGNLTKGTWSKAIADLQLASRSRNTKTRAQGGAKRILYFMQKHRNGKRIIYKKVRGGIIPWIVEVSRPRYGRRLRFPRIVRGVMNKEYGPLFDKAMQRELAKAG